MREDQKCRQNFDVDQNTLIRDHASSIAETRNLAVRTGACWPCGLDSPSDSYCSAIFAFECTVL